MKKSGFCIRVLILLLLMTFFGLPTFAQEGEETETVPTVEVLVIEAPEVADAVETAPVVEAPAEVPAEAAEWVSPEVLVIAGSIVLVVGLGGVFLLLLKALDALKVSVPQETLNMIGKQLLEVIIHTREGVSKQVQESPSPIDDMFYAIANVPLDAIVKEIERRTGSVPVELMVHLGLSEEVKPDGS